MENPAGNNLAAKILAVILAAILWMYVMNEQNPPIEASFAVPLEQKNLLANHLVSNVPDTVRVRLRGPRSIIAGISANDIKCFIDLANLTEGKHTVKVNLIIPSALEVIEVNPDKVVLTIEKIISRQLPVEIRLKGNALVGMVVGKTSSEPSEVAIEGAASEVESVLRVVSNVDLTGKNADFAEEIKLIALNRDGKEVQGVTIRPSKINVHISLLKQQNKAVVGIKYLTFGELPQGIILKNITTQPDKIELSGLKEDIDKIPYVYTEPINLTGITQSTVREVNLQLKEGIVASNNKVTVNINVESAR